MKKMLGLFTSFFLLLMLMGCQEKSMNKKIEFEMGDTDVEFMQKNGLDEGDVDKQPAGINFIEGRFPKEDLGMVSITSAGEVFYLYNVYGFMGSVDLEDPSGVIDQFDVRWNFYEGSGGSHEEARVYLLGLFEDLLSKGWRYYIANSKPRLKGEDSFKYYLEKKSSVIPLDPSYQLSLDEWMSLDSSMTWRFVNEEAFLSIQMYRDPSAMTKGEPGAYIFSLTLSPLEAIGQNAVGVDHRNEWEDYWVKVTKKYKTMRYQTEKELEEQGYTIFREYQEPIIHPEDPVEP
jgi:hypothetical protein